MIARFDPFRRRVHRSRWLKTPLATWRRWTALLAGLVCLVATVERSPAQIVLRNVSAQTGIDFVHNDGSGGHHYIVETVASGIATFDYDGDGRIDIYFLNGRPLKGTTCAVPPKNALYRNLGGWKFSDATEKAGMAGTAFGLGVCVGDYDNDGLPDVYVNNYGLNNLFHNNGDGSFTDVAQRAGVTRGFTVGAGANFLDADGDGNLDLYVSNYVLFRYDNHVPGRFRGVTQYPGPDAYPHQPSNFYRNNGDGTFTDATKQSGIDLCPGPGMGTVCLDYDNDGATDIFVCNDMSANFLFHNDGKGRFEEVALLTGVAANLSGDAMASMGADVADYDHDGRLDIFMTDYQGEMPLLFHNLGGGMFEDATMRTGAHAGGLPYVKWGCGFADFDNDGLKDIFYGCGHTHENIELIDRRTKYRCAPILLRNAGNGRFVDVTRSGGDLAGLEEVARGVALEDLDNDGRVDVVILSSRRRPVVLRNETQTDNHWIEIRLRGVKTNRDGVGASVRVAAGELVQTDEVHSGRGYQSHFGSRLHFGLGTHERADRIEVRWIGGGVDVFHNVAVDREITLEEGQSIGVGGKPRGPE